MKRPPVWVLITLVVGVLALVALQVRVIRVQDQVAVAWSWQVGQVRFINSVTGRPVLIRFGLRHDFSDFQMITDPDTEGYYTLGEYRINTRLRHERLRALNYCSVVGIAVRIGDHQWNINQSCLSAQLLWPPGSTGLPRPY